MLLWEGHRPQLLPINLRTHARARQPTHPSSLSQAGPTPRQSDVGQVNRMTLARWSSGTQKKKETEKKKKKKRRQPRWTCVICECASHSQAFSRGARVPAAAASRHRCRARGALAVGPTHGGGGGPHWTVTVTWLSRSMRRDTTVAMRKLFFFFSLFHRPTSPHEVVGLGRGLSKHLVVLLWGRFCQYFFFFYSDPTTATRWRNSAGSGLDVCSPEFIRAAAVGG